jgi:hypothetical protein
VYGYSTRFFKGTTFDFLLVRLTSKENKRTLQLRDERIMKLLLQRKENLEFIQTRGASWTIHRGRAHAFANGLEAILFCYDRHLTDMQILATFSDARLDFTVPIARA